MDVLGLLQGASTRRTWRNVPRPGVVYGYLTRQHGSRMVVEFGYGGQSRNPARRDAWHREFQPWSDLIDGDMIVIAAGRWTNVELDAVEDAVIGGQWDMVLALATAEVRRRTGNPHAQPDTAGLWRCAAASLRPRYNITGNLDNPEQIPSWVAVAQRRQREPGWVPPPSPREHTRPGSARVWVEPGAGLDALVRARARRLMASLMDRAARALVWTVVWTVLALIVGVGLVAWKGLPAGDGAWVGAGSASLLLGGLKVRRRRSRRSRRR